MNIRNEESIKIINVLDECGYEVVEIRPQYVRAKESGYEIDTGYILLKIWPKEIEE